MYFSIYPRIPSSYSPKAENSTTIEAWNIENKKVSRYLTSYQFVVPLFVAVISIVAISFFLFSNSQAYHDTVKELIDSKTAAGWELRTNMYILMAISVIISGYIFGMDMAAVGFRNQHKTKREFEWFHDNYDTRSPLDQLYHLTTGLSVMDALIFFLCLIVLSVYNINYCLKKKENKDTDRLYSCTCLKTALPWYFLVFPSVNLAVHADQIIIGFIHNSYHATAVGISYGIILVTCVALLRFISHLIHARLTKAGGNGYKNRDWVSNCIGKYDFILVLIFVAVLVLVILSFMYLISLYFLLPISGAIDDAPNRIVTIYNSIVVVFAAYLTYWVVIKRHSSPLDFLIKAKNKAKNGESNTDEDWKKATYDMKELTIAEDVLMALNRTANWGSNTQQVKNGDREGNGQRGEIGEGDGQQGENGEGNGQRGEIGKEQGENGEGNGQRGEIGKGDGQQGENGEDNGEQDLEETKL